MGAAVFGVVLWTHAELRREAIAGAQDEVLRLARIAILEQENAIQEVKKLLIVLASVPDVRRDDMAACSAFFADLLRELPRYANFGTIRPTGDIVCSGHPLRSPVNVGDRLYVRRALETGRFAIGEYQMGRVTGRPTLNFGYPIKDPGGAVRGVVFAAMDLGWLNHLAARARLPQGSTLSVFDANGLVLGRYPDPERWLGKVVADAPIVRHVRATQGEATAEDVGLDGVSRVFALAPLPKSEAGGSVFVVVGVPRAVVLAGVERLLRRNLVATAVLTLVAAGLVWFGSGRIALREALYGSPFAADLGRGRGRRPHGRIRAYGSAVTCVAAAVALQLAIWPYVQPTVTPPFFAAVMLSAWLGGLGPGLVATVLSAVASAYFFIPPVYSFRIGWDDFLRLVGFAAVALLISMLNDRRMRAEMNLRRHADQQGRVAELGRRALGGADLAKLSAEAVAGIGETLDVEWTVLLEEVPGAAGLVTRAAWGRGQQRVPDVLRVESGSLIADALQATQPVVSDVTCERATSLPAFATEGGAIGGIAVPVYGRDRRWGVLAAFTASRRPFTRDDIVFFQSAAHVLTMAVQREPVGTG